MNRLQFDSLDALDEEVKRAREKFPRPSYLFTALVEEKGELDEAVRRMLYAHVVLGEKIGNGLARAFLQGKDREQIRSEALQVACVAMRIYEEGDPTFDGMDDAAKKA